MRKKDKIKQQQVALQEEQLRQANVGVAINDVFNSPMIDYTNAAIGSLPTQTTAQKLAEIARMDSTQFECYVYRLFLLKGCTADFTPITNDYGADFILHNGAENIAVRCKLVYDDSLLGTQIIDDVLGALHYYVSNSAMIVTNGLFSAQARKYADKQGVSIIDRGAFVKEFLNYIPVQFRPTVTDNYGEEDN